MNKPSNLLKFALVLGFGAAAWFGYSAIKKPKYGIDNPSPEEIAFITGNLPLLPGPYLAEGNPADLKFEKIDLGIAEAVEMSEQGDILYKWYGDKPVEVPFKDVDGFDRKRYTVPAPITRLRRADGKIQDFPADVDVRLTRGGKVFEIHGKDSNVKITFGGKTVFENANSSFSRNTLYLGFDTTITDDGILPNGSSEPHFAFDKDLKTSKIDLENKPYAYYRTSSTEIGTVGIVTPNGTLDEWRKRYRLAVLKDGKPSFYDVPEGTFSLHVKAAKKCLYIYNGPWYSTKPYRFEDGKFTVVPIPSGGVAISGLCGNSNGDMLFQLHVPIANQIERRDFPYLLPTYYVSNGKSYETNKLFKANGFKEDFSRLSDFYRPEVIIDEQGDFLAAGGGADFTHLYFMRRVH